MLLIVGKLMLEEIAAEYQQDEKMESLMTLIVGRVPEVTLLLRLRLIQEQEFHFQQSDAKFQEMDCEGKFHIYDQTAEWK
jgi:hypothetical protein